MWLRLGSLLFAAPGILLLTLYGLEMSAATDCSQSGGFYDFVNSLCSDKPQPQSSYYQRHSMLVNLMMLLSVIGTFAMIWGMLIKGMARPKEPS
ncbi:MAG: hypothetical protein LRY66_03915 [Saccharospirillaceae bacterium]|nr:hypothetical protein [Saccharospirillaceae bacterium]MCD8530504.1 hypothetical protein [Saccharospirillaceae bacterium]